MLGRFTTRLFLQRGLPLLQRPLSSHAHTKGQVAVVTGAAKGMGRAIALRLANDGYDVSINDIPSAETKLQEVGSLISKAGRRAFLCTADMSVEDDVKRLVESTAENLGSVDVMIANAGICVFKPLSETTASDWDMIFKVNARGIFLCYKYAAQQMIKQGRGGRIIGASSVSGKRGAPGLLAYSSSKFAVRGLTQATAQELAPHGITVNAYAPGLIETDMLDYIRSTPLAANVTYMNNPIGVLGFNGTPDDIAGLVSYLTSPEARFITGQSVTIDGGYFFD